MKKILSYLLQLIFIVLMVIVFNHLLQFLKFGYFFENQFFKIIMLGISLGFAYYLNEIFFLRFSIIIELLFLLILFAIELLLTLS